jgi:hypothetical protein
MTSINEILSDELKVTPLREGERVEFRLVLFGQYSPILEGPNAPAGRGLAARCDILDPFDKKNPVKQIMNIKSLRPIMTMGQQTGYEPLGEMIMFPASGGIICGHNDNNKYMYLKRHNKNRDNPWRNRLKEAVFFEVNEQKEMKKANDLFEYKATAGYELVKASDSQIAVIASRFNDSIGKFNRNLRLDISKDNGSLRKSLQMLSVSNPAELLLAMDVDELVARVMADTAVDQRWMLFNDHSEKMCWEWLRKPGEAGGRKIVEVKDPADDAFKSLATFLTTKEGSTHFAELKVRHAQYYAAAPVVV